MSISKIEKSDWYEDYIVHWRPTDMCNYDCSYCEPSNHLPIVKSKLPKSLTKTLKIIIHRLSSGADIMKMISGMSRVIENMKFKKLLKAYCLYLRM